MGLSRFLNHRVTIYRRVTAGLDAYGQPVVTEEVLAADVAAGLQPRSAREVAAIHQAGAQLGDYRAYLQPRDVTAADVLVHTQAACGAPNDLPDGRWEVLGVSDAAGAGHHLQLDCALVVASVVGAPAGS